MAGIPVTIVGSWLGITNRVWEREWGGKQDRQEGADSKGLISASLNTETKAKPLLNTDAT